MQFFKYLNENVQCLPVVTRNVCTHWCATPSKQQLSPGFLPCRYHQPIQWEPHCHAQHSLPQRFGSGEVQDSSACSWHQWASVPREEARSHKRNLSEFFITSCLHSSCLLFYCSFSFQWHTNVDYQTLTSIHDSSILDFLWEIRYWPIMCQETNNTKIQWNMYHAYTCISEDQKIQLLSYPTC